jgi:hypothetical protein
MNRIFGSSASKKPKPSLQDAIASVSLIEISGYIYELLMNRSDRRENRLNRGQSEETRWRACEIQRANEQTPEWTGQSNWLLGHLVELV